MKQARAVKAWAFTGKSRRGPWISARTWQRRISGRREMGHTPAATGELVLAPASSFVRVLVSPLPTRGRKP